VEGMTANWSDDESRSIDGFKLIHSQPRRKLSHAAVVLVDRSEDYFTPLSCGGKHPLAHRILNTLKCYQFTDRNHDWKSNESRIDGVSIQHAASIAPAHDCISTARRINVKATLPLLAPMSGLTRLPFHLSPSLKYHYKRDVFFQKLSPDGDLQNAASESGYGMTQHEKNLTHLHILSGSEESGRESLVSNLKARIVVEGGRLPLLKKHGLGAEVLAYVQALIDSPGRKQTQLTPSLGYNPRVCIQSSEMIALALAVVESMQRSSSKQFQTICDWQCSYEVRCSRETEMIHHLQQQEQSNKSHSLDECIELLHTQLSARCQNAKGKENEKNKGSENNTVDVIYTLTQIIRYVNLITSIHFSFIFLVG